MGWAGLPTGERVELVLVAVTLAAARRLGAIHHRLEPTGHVHVQHLVPPDEIMLLSEGDRHGDAEGERQFGYISPSGNSGESHRNACCSV